MTKVKTLYKKADIIKQLNEKSSWLHCGDMDVTDCADACALSDIRECFGNPILANKVEKIKEIKHFENVKSAKTLINNLEGLMFDSPTNCHYRIQITN
jgi:hypothetical protein